LLFPTAPVSRTHYVDPVLLGADGEVFVTKGGMRADYGRKIRAGIVRPPSVSSMTSLIVFAYGDLLSRPARFGRNQKKNGYDIGSILSLGNLSFLNWQQYICRHRANIVIFALYGQIACVAA
jgi:hypothetical protein